MSDILGDILGWIVAEVFGAILDVLMSPFVDRWNDRRADPEVVVRSRVDSAFRIVEGSHPRLTRRWRGGVAEVVPGSLYFGRRVIGRRIATIEVLSVRPGSRRRPSRRETRFGVSAKCTIVEVVTATAVLEWAVPRQHVDVALERLTSRAAPLSPTGRAQR